MNDQTFPNAIGAERSLLGCIIMDSSLISKVKDLVGPEDFYDGRHRRIMELVLKMHESGDAIDQMTVVQVVASSGADERTYGGPAYVLGLSDSVVTMLHTEQHASLIRQTSIRRMMMMGFKDLSMKVQDSETALAAVVSECMSLAKRASDQAPGRSVWKDMEAVIDAHDKEMEERFRAANEQRVIGVPTGLIELDHKLGGLKPGKSYVVAARPAMGKSAVLSNILTYAGRNGHRCAEFSLEMGDVELFDRQLADVAGINYGRLQSGKLDKLDMTRMDDAKNEMYSWPIHLDDTPGRSIGQICAAARQLKSKHPDLSLIGLDYIQLTQASSPEAKKKREQAISEISRELKLLARELNVATVVLAQLNRECERRPNKRPMLSDLRESGAIEQNADAVIMLYRDEYYNPDSPDKGVAELLIRKNRGGATGKVRLLWEPEYQRFSTLAENVVTLYGSSGFTPDPDDDLGFSG
tara:strand:+ start:607 stop:2010 length:1404 start_codon:yes stop_codon:yes gene_type:complete